MEFCNLTIWLSEPLRLFIVVCNSFISFSAVFVLIEFNFDCNSLIKEGLTNELLFAIFNLDCKLSFILLIFNCS